MRPMAVVASISSKSGRRLEEGFDFNLHSSIEKSAAVTRECPWADQRKPSPILQMGLFMLHSPNITTDITTNGGESRASH
jgi:hypothetical protein